MINSRRRSSAVLVAVVGLLFSILNITAASSQPIPLPGLVSDNPADWTPWVYGDIKSFVQVGPLMYGGVASRLSSRLGVPTPTTATTSWVSMLPAAWSRPIPLPSTVMC